MTDIAELVRRVDDYETICLLGGVTSTAGLMREIHNALEALTAENQRLREALETARAEEREACAKVADEYDARMMRLSEKSNLNASALTAMALAAGDIATEIRERG